MTLAQRLRRTCRYGFSPPVATSGSNRNGWSAPQPTSSPTLVVKRSVRRAPSPSRLSSVARNGAVVNGNSALFDRRYQEVAGHPHAPLPVPRQRGGPTRAGRSSVFWWKPRPIGSDAHVDLATGRKRIPEMDGRQAFWGLPLAQQRLRSPCPSFGMVKLLRLCAGCLTGTLT